MNSTASNQCSGQPSRMNYRWLMGILFMQAMTMLAVWKTEQGPAAARADIPDGGAADRRAMIEEMKGANARLDKLIAILQGGDLQVRVVRADENKAGR